MPTRKREQVARETVRDIHNGVTVQAAPDVETIRREAVAMFARALNLKLKNLQDGETLQITFRVDIVGVDGKIRGGQNAQRSMPEYQEWREAVLKRDGYACRECGAKGGLLSAHHVKEWAKYPELRFDIENGLTLCESCHAEKHPHLKMMQHGKTDET